MRQRLAAVTLVLLCAGAFAAAESLNHPTGSTGLFLVDKLGGHVRFFDLSFKEQAAIQLGANPHDFVLSADHTLAYVPIYGDGVYGRNPNPGHEIAIIELATRKVAGMIDVAPYRAPHGIQIDTDGTLYVASDLDRKLLVIDPKTRSIKAAIDTDGTGHWIALVPEARKVYVANKDDRPFVSVIDLRTQKMIGKVPAPNGTQGIAASPDGKTVVAIDMKEPVALVIDPATDTVRDRLPLGQKGAGYKPYYSPDGSRLVIISTSTTTAKIFDATNLRAPFKDVQVGKAPMGVAFSKDGNTALIANHGEGTVSAIDLRTSAVTTTFKAGTGIETLTYY